MGGVIDHVKKTIRRNIISNLLLYQDGEFILIHHVRENSKSI